MEHRYLLISLTSQLRGSCDLHSAPLHSAPFCSTPLYSGLLRFPPPKIYTCWLMVPPIPSPKPSKSPKIDHFLRAPPKIYTCWLMVPPMPTPFCSIPIPFFNISIGIRGTINRRRRSKPEQTGADAEMSPNDQKRRKNSIETELVHTLRGNSGT